MGRLIALANLVLGLFLLVVAPAVAQTRQGAGDVVVLTVSGAITPVVAQYLERGLTEAEKSGARAVVVRIDTPGGLDTSMRAIIQRILASKVPVITYVSPAGARAASAGAFISFAAHVAAMAPNTTIGSASPVNLGGGGQAETMSDTMTAKVTNDAVSYIRGLAERRGRNAEWAERAVRQAANLPAREALDQRVVDIVATDLEDLLRQADGRVVQLEASSVTLRTEGATLLRSEPNLIEAFLQLIADPSIAYLLLSLGMLGLYLELSNPGSILPGVAGAILLVLALFALGSLPVNWAGALLMALAFVLFGIDLVAPTHGVLTVGGLVAFTLGSLLLINHGDPVFQIAPSVIIGVVLSLAAFFLFITTVVLRDFHRRPVTGREGLIGAIAIARSRLAPRGTVFVEGELWQATSQSGPIEIGQSARVVAVDGLNLRVAAVVPAGKEQPA